MCDTAGVRRTLHAYCRLLDERRLDELVATVYTADAIDDRQRGAAMRGRAEICAYFERAMTNLRATAHLLSNVDVTLDPTGRTAEATSRVTAYHWSEPAPAGSTGAADFVLLGTYTDRLCRSAGGWLIQHRVVGALGPNGLAVGALPPVFAGFGGRT